MVKSTETGDNLASLLGMGIRITCDRCVARRVVYDTGILINSDTHTTRSDPRPTGRVKISRSYHTMLLLVLGASDTRSCLMTSAVIRPVGCGGNTMGPVVAANDHSLSVVAFIPHLDANEHCPNHGAGRGLLGHYTRKARPDFDPDHLACLNDLFSRHGSRRCLGSLSLCQSLTEFAQSATPPFTLAI
jgi:hypothetical protein